MNEADRDATQAPPVMFHHTLGAHEPLEPLRPGPEIQDLHAGWVALHAAHQPVPPAQAEEAGAPTPQGARQRIRANAVARARALATRLVVTEPAPQPPPERALIGALIRATDALAARCDEISERLQTLESSLTEAIEVFSEELTFLRAALARSEPAQASPPTSQPGRGSEDAGQGPGGRDAQKAKDARSASDPGTGGGRAREG
jgi:hypothetical protein